ncbi:SAM-dependent methyltransferase [Botrimarina sp.]|uniref:SAM-dependent methyltransferase n=1 Tax=Botrimarina sp. TaxID=2795802 RepID=UPI0032EF164A
MPADAEFAYCVCQPGAEPALKQEVAARAPAWRFAFSRPGFVTFKLPEPTPPDRFDPMRLTFARAIGLSFGRLDADEADGAAFAARVWAMPAVAELIAAGPVRLQVWRRESQLPGDDGHEPGPTAESLAAMEALRAAAPEGAVTSDSRMSLDVALVEPNQWWAGAHAIRSRTDRWAGGTPRVEAPEHAVSRAYLKLKEGLLWSGLPAAPGDYWLELGCAPGGASQALLDAGMRVVGVDPAEVDPIVTAHPDFEHLRARANEIGVDEVTDIAWITSDINAAPDYTLDAVERLVTHPSTHVRGLLLTLKLLGPNLARPEVVAATIGRVRSWGYGEVRTRQLAHNRREYCLAAVRSRGQRRLARGRKRQADPRKGTRR